MVEILINDGNYSGKYVAFNNDKDREIICSNESALKTYEEAFGKGFESPVIVYVPDKDVVQIL